MNKVYKKLNKIIDKLIFIKKYKKYNLHNETIPLGDFRLSSVEIGNYSYGLVDVTDYSNNLATVRIGHFCSIARDVKFILGGDHSTQNLSTFPFKVKFGLLEREAESKGHIIIEDDVWIGVNCVILSGVTIGQGSVVSAGSVITKNIPPYAIVGGVPAKIIKFRFSERIISKMLKIKYSRLTKEIVINNIDLFYEKINEENVDQYIERINNAN